MAAGLPDLVDSARLAEDAAVLERVYELGELPRLQDVLAEPRGVLNATIAFWKAPSGRAGASVAIRALPQLVCQRCMQGFAFPVDGGSDVEFADGEPDTERELFRAERGLVRLRDLAEEELLLALPIAPMCGTPRTCGHAPSVAIDAETSEVSEELRRPFAALHDLLKKT